MRTDSIGLEDLGVPSPAAATRPLRVLLVNMPWSSTTSPSIQCGLLQALACQDGHECDVAYLNLEFAAKLGGEVYSEIADMTGERLHMLGEWLFSFAAFGETTPDADYLLDFPEIAPSLRNDDWDGDALVKLRREDVPAWIDELVSRDSWRKYDVVGFTSTFLQNTASLALGRRLKERYPRITLVYGGANFDGCMGEEYARVIQWIDYVVSGEADLTFPALLRAISSGDECAIPGVTGQGAPASAEPARVPASQADMDALPVPDYHDYFEQLEYVGQRMVLAGGRVTLPLELSRGCWWGQKHHCTFCGLNALGMDFRPKSPVRALSEVTTLLTRHPVVHLDAVDNILGMRYLKTLCADMASRHWDVNLFFEVKANLTRAQLSVLRDAGVLRIQPGLESLSTAVLKLMRKGSTRLINVRLLKWAMYYGIDVSWNLLLGFPGETDSNYEDQLKIMSLLTHLQPPAGVTRIWMERFGPYFEDPSFGFSEITPKACYRHIYPGDLDFSKIAYFFDYTVTDTCSHDLEERLAVAVRDWKRRHREERPSLVYQRLPDRVVIVDLRGPDARRAVLSGWRGDAYETCGDIRSTAGVTDVVRESGYDVTEEQVATFLDACCQEGVMLADDGKYLSIALPENPHW